MGDTFEGIVGHERAIWMLRHQLETGRLNHAYLFHGESGLGKATVARAFAEALLPEMALSRHPDYWEDDRNGPISIDEIRLLPDKQPEHHVQSLQAFLSLKPAVGGRRVALLTNAGRLPDQTQGILLKTLEEPQPNRVIILTSPSLNPFVVLPTVVSRCQRVAFHPVAEEEMRKLPVSAEVIAASGGRPGWALRASSDASLMDDHRHWAQRLREVMASPADIAMGIAAELDSAQMSWRRAKEERPDPALVALDAWALELRRRMIDDPRQRWAQLLEATYETRGQLEQNVSPRLALEVLLLQCRAS